MSSEEIFNDRKNKFLKIGRNKGFISNLEDLSSLKPDKTDLYQILKSKKNLLIGTGIVLIAIYICVLFIFYKAPQQRLYFFPDPHGQGSFLLIFLSKDLLVIFSSL